MAYTKFAEFLRVLRVKNHENMGDAAKLLGVKVAFVSAVETGKKNVPEDWVDKLVEHYNLNAQEKAELIQAISKEKRGKSDKNHLAEEMADVLICIEILKQVYQISDHDIDNWIEKKQTRIYERMNGFS